MYVRFAATAPSSSSRAASSAPPRCRPAQVATCATRSRKTPMPRPTTRSAIPRRPHHATARSPICVPPNLSAHSPAISEPGPQAPVPARHPLHHHHASPPGPRRHRNHPAVARPRAARDQPSLPRAAPAVQKNAPPSLDPLGQRIQRFKVDSSLPTFLPRPSGFRPPETPLQSPAKDGNPCSVATLEVPSDHTLGGAAGRDSNDGGSASILGKATGRRRTTLLTTRRGEADVRSQNYRDRPPN